MNDTRGTLILGLLLLLALIAAVAIALVAPQPVRGSDPEPSFAFDSPPPAVCGLYPGWEPGDQWGGGPDDAIECPDELVEPQPSAAPERLAPASSPTPRPTPIVVGQDLGSEIPAVSSIDLPATDTAP